MSKQINTDTVAALLLATNKEKFDKIAYGDVMAHLNYLLGLENQLQKKQNRLQQKENILQQRVKKLQQKNAVSSPSSTPTNIDLTNIYPLHPQVSSPLRIKQASKPSSSTSTAAGMGRALASPSDRFESINSRLRRKQASKPSSSTSTAAGMGRALASPLSLSPSSQPTTSITIPTTPTESISIVGQEGVGGPITSTTTSTTSTPTTTTTSTASTTPTTTTTSTAIPTTITTINVGKRGSSTTAQSSASSTTAAGMVIKKSKQGQGQKQGKGQTLTAVTETGNNGSPIPSPTSTTIPTTISSSSPTSTTIQSSNISSTQPSILRKQQKGGSITPTLGQGGSTISPTKIKQLQKKLHPSLWGTFLDKPVLWKQTTSPETKLQLLQKLQSLSTSNKDAWTTIKAYMFNPNLTNNAFLDNLTTNPTTDPNIIQLIRKITQQIKKKE